jgi:hypothetical protein
VPGCLILPGIVDLHGVRDGGGAAAAGVTTAWVAQDWSWEGGAGAPDRAEAALCGLRGPGAPGSTCGRSCGSRRIWWTRRRG